MIFQMQAAFSKKYRKDRLICNLKLSFPDPILFRSFGEL